MFLVQAMYGPVQLVQDLCVCVCARGMHVLTICGDEHCSFGQQE